MAIGYNQITITTSPTLIFAGDPDGACVHIYVQSGIYLGNENVSAINGHWRPSNSDINLLLGPSEKIYGITASGTALISYLSTLNN